MAIKRFKPGDRVRHYGGGPVMRVENYAPIKRHFIGAPQSGYWVNCSWFSNGKQYSQVFNQDVLIKLNYGDNVLNHQMAARTWAN
jgi:uncharacterized protein YodC (DUF2158 family)